MSNNFEHKNQIRSGDEFTSRLDFYWQSTTVYAIILIIYSIVRSTISDGAITLVLWDPVVILLCVFIVYSGFSLLLNMYKKKTLVIGKDYISISTRFGVKKYLAKDILRISFVRVRLFRVRGAYKMIKIKIAGRRRLIRIRTSSFWEETKLLASIAKFKKQYSK